MRRGDRAIAKKKAKPDVSEADQDQRAGNYLKIIQEEAIRAIAKMKAKHNGSEANQDQGAENSVNKLGSVSGNPTGTVQTNFSGDSHC